MEDFGKCMENAIVFDDQNFKPYTGKCTRYNLVLNRADSAELDGIAQDLGIDPRCLVRLGVRMLATAYAVNPQPFFSEAERVRQIQIDALTLDVRELRRRAKAGKSEPLPDKDSSFYPGNDGFTVE